MILTKHENMSSCFSFILFITTAKSDTGALGSLLNNGLYASTTYTTKNDIKNE